MKVWAHRGFSSIYPENTMLAFEKALECGAYGIEMDCHLSLDGEIVIIHDENLLRTCGVDKRVEECTFEELIKTRASRTQGDRFNTTIPSFEEFCSFIKKNPIMANIELKTGVVYYPHLEEKVIDMVKRYKIENKVLFSSFNWLSLVICKRLLPSVPVGLLFDLKDSIKHISYLARECGFEYLHPDYSCINDEMIYESRKEKIAINAWTIKSDEEIRRLDELKVEGIITNSPDIALGVIKSLNAF